MDKKEMFEKWEFENYKSPIQIYTDHFVTEVTKDLEGNIVAKARQVCDIKIDKEELLKALNYDREQYSRGFAHGFECGCKAERDHILTAIYNAIGDDEVDE